MLHEQSRGLGLGAGKEGLIYALTNVCGEVTATDLYNSANWQTAAMSVNAVYEANPFPYRKERLVVRNMDMTQIEFPENSFDFVWSCCAIEHVNNFRELHRVYEEIHRVLKPGGVAALTTEYNLSDHHSYEPNMLFTDPFWIEKWLTGADPLLQGFELVDPPDLTLTPAPGNTPQPRSKTPRTWVPVYSRNMIIDSVAFFLRKTGSFSRAYDDQWLPHQDWRIYWQGCDRLQEKDFVGAEPIFISLFQDTTDAKLKVAAVRRLLVSLQAQGKTAEAIDYCQKVIPYCEQDADTDHLLPIASQCRKYKLWHEAQHLFQKVIDCPGARDVQVVRSLLGRAEYCDLQNRPYEALKLAEQACQVLPTDRDVVEISHAQYY
ncbi:MAG TPA: class I SAM-dependent methyltransferase, partial [Allocoleopsis sp.]